MERSEYNKKGAVTFLGIFSPPLPMAGPIGEALTAVGAVGGSVGHDLDPEQTVGEIAVVEREGEVGVAAGGVGGVVRVHDRPRIEQIQILIFHSLSL